ncbi:MAG: FAD-dependent oxidoreductase [Pseudomonadales bacterium]
MDTLTLAHNCAFEDLYSDAGLHKIDALFIESVRSADPDLADRLLAARADNGALEAVPLSELLVELAPLVEAWLIELFQLQGPASALSERHTSIQSIYTCKRLFVQRQAVRKYKLADAGTFDGAALEQQLAEKLGGPVTEESFATEVMAWLDAQTPDADAIDLALRFAAWSTLTPAGQGRWANGILFKVPRKITPFELVETVELDRKGVPMVAGPPAHYRHREGFDLTDNGMDLGHALDQANYCIWCHNQDKDSCSKGLKDRKTGAFKQNAFSVDLTGCPLEEKISEMNLVKSQGFSLGALALITIDNPLCAATGHRICNDCMKSCIYQKQDPVDIPQVESRILKDVLELPWGFEIYSLLTRWSPLDFNRWLPRPQTDRRVLVVGLGPAGFNLAHHLLNDGHTVVAVDGLKIEPLPAELSGVDAHGKRSAFQPIKDAQSLREALGDRVLAGFGGVAEYGITVRWDKNYLKIIRLLLERREHFALHGGVRFGGTLTIDDAWAQGFDHIAMCAGAGRPNFIHVPNALAKGVRMASDFLMALQLTGAARADSVANLQLRLPVVVIGGGLTAIDAATEALAYYPVQVEKFLKRYESLVAANGEESVHGSWTNEERNTADEFIRHARAIRAERSAALQANREPAIAQLLGEWGGVTVAYRRRMIDAPSYTGNHEELAKAFEEQVRFAELLAPEAIGVDEFGSVADISFARTAIDEDGKLQSTGEQIQLDARTVLVAAGTQPNTVLAREDTHNLPPLTGKYFQAFDLEGEAVEPMPIAKPDEAHIFMSWFADGQAMSFWGDLHPSYAGNVVKAMGGTKQGYPLISQALERLPAASHTAKEWLSDFNDSIRPTVHEIIRLTPTIVELIIHAPLQARNFQPGQFYRLQNYETLAPRANDTLLAMEGLALTGAWVDKERGLISAIVLEMGGSSNLCQLLKPGEPVVLMGPTGTPTEITDNETVMLVGGGLGNAVLFSIGQAMRRAGSKVLYFAGYKAMQDRYHVENIEAAADQIIWCCDEAPGFTPNRPQDATFVGNIVDAIAAYGSGAIGPQDKNQRLDTRSVDRIIAIGSDRMMGALATARHGKLAQHLKSGHVAIGSINSPMQCMMKEICAQCLQKHRNPQTGEETIVFSCFNQDQELDHVDFLSLNTRLNQNAAQEKLTSQWIDHCLKAS